jgi:hypothetical protein
MNDPTTTLQTIRDYCNSVLEHSTPTEPASMKTTLRLHVPNVCDSAMSGRLNRNGDERPRPTRRERNNDEN